MLVFVVPLKSRQASKSWERVSKLLERCVKSICAQTSPEFRVIVVCNEKPNITFTHPHLTYIEVNFALPNENNNVNKGRTDKGRKILKGLIEAKQFNPTHTMTVDADDCVSQKLTQFVNLKPDCHGWFINRGYKYQEGSKYIYVKHNNFYKMCGSCNIIRYDLNFLPKNPEYNRGYGYYKYYIDHAKVRVTLTNKEKSIKPLPFPGAIYMLGTGEHHFYDQTKLGFNIINRRLLNQSIQEEFGVYKI